MPAAKIPARNHTFIRIRMHIHTYYIHRCVRTSVSVDIRVSYVNRVVERLHLRVWSCVVIGEKEGDEGGRPTARIAERVGSEGIQSRPPDTSTGGTMRIFEHRCCAKKGGKT